MPTNLPAAFAALRDVLKKHAAGMIVVADTHADFTVTSPANGPNGKPLWFGCVLLKKSAVTYHLFPLYFNPKLKAAIPAELLPRKQGKTCFNFQRPDPNLFAQLDTLTQLAREGLERHGLLNPGQVSPETFNNALRAAGEDPDAIAKLRKSKGKAAVNKRAATIKKKTATANRPRTAH
ncbi:MAG: hypothetical protein JWN40_774 [Phycisphaerales bacterium]|nr:hypothetical protein [Phycisphaerales bacterium]